MYAPWIEFNGYNWRNPNDLQRLTIPPLDYQGKHMFVYFMKMSEFHDIKKTLETYPQRNADDVFRLLKRLEYYKNREAHEGPKNYVILFAIEDLDE